MAMYESSEPASLLTFLQQLGRVRANEIRLEDAQAGVLYASPASTYKAGRNAPDWFTDLLRPTSASHVFPLTAGKRLVLEPNASRAILDGWDDLKNLLLFAAFSLAALNALVFWLVGRAVAPLPIIAGGLKRIEEGDLSYRLPALSGEEAGHIADAFNYMAAAVQDKWEAERQARAAEARLEERREISLLMEQRLDEERRLIARELHDEFAQSVTAIRSLAAAIVGQPDTGARTREAAQLIATEAARLYDVMHGLIPRLAPLALDVPGLTHTLDSLVKDWQRRHPDLVLALHQDLPTELGSSVTLAIYRVVQEALINALRHAHPSRIDIDVAGNANRITVRVTDNGVGLPADWSRPGRFGLRGLQERVATLDGVLRIANREPRGVELVAEIPLGPVTESLGATDVSTPA
jgi:two-component system sensor histidine kinase UhpB